jgi:hypothetical protein
MTKKGKSWRPPPQARSGPSRTGRSTTTKPGTSPSRSRAAEADADRISDQPVATGSNRQARKEEARRQREALKRKAARRRLITRILGVAGAVVVVAGVVLAFLFIGSGTKIPDDLPGIQKDTEPWPAEHAHMQARLHDVHIGFLGQEALAFHIHQHLDLFVNGQRVSVPSQIGISGGFAFLHTHDATGVIHVESPVVKKYTLGNFFDVWGVLFTKDQLAAYTTSGNAKLWVFVNGKPFTGDPRNLVLRNFQEIVVAYGTRSQLPNPIPKPYSEFEQAKKAEREARQKAQATPTPSASAVSPSASPSS